MLHNQLWISFSRYRLAKATNIIVLDRGLEFHQVDREITWDDQILLTGILYYGGYMIFPEASYMPYWRTDGVIITALLHMGVVEFLYYWLHRALHHHFLYSPVIHPFAEVLAYFVLFAIPQLTALFTRTISIASLFGYVFYIDFMNNLGHCNFEFIPNKLFSFFPIFKYLCYTPSFHSLHHTKFRTNYSLFMPIYDYIYGTMDEASDETYETSLKRPKESPNVVHLTHLTTPDSLYHLPIGIASLASNPLSSSSSKWYLRFMWPFTFWFNLMAWILGHSFVSERTTFKNLTLQTWVVPRFTKQYLSKKQTPKLNKLIEEAILEANSCGVKVLSLGLLNQMKIVDGSNLAAAIVVNSIPKGTNKVLLRGNFDKLYFSIANALCQRNVQVVTLYQDELRMLELKLNTKRKQSFALLAADSTLKIWLVGDGWNEEEQKKAPKGSVFIPFSQFPPNKLRKDCFYHYTPAMIAPPSFINMYSCENWLPRRAMSGWRIAGIVHALEARNTIDCGFTTFSINNIWHATLRHGFQPLNTHHSL
ncbi:very-long-chain aldehyde decarbonylase CER1-like [Senna tora]|uniref:Very-long-chain aldehyde decarbonylase CER1-like n=1 Tax=Senna tora TaxID=362788 RepID=A0A835CKP5_9FABA|nr:very-long-chain aldehyde decarbonylase CER1-like [Senna tora]